MAATTADHRGGEQPTRHDDREDRGVQHPRRLAAATRTYGRFLRRRVVRAKRDGLAEVRTAVLALRLERLAEHVVIRSERVGRVRTLRSEPVRLRIGRGGVGPLAGLL